MSFTNNKYFSLYRDTDLEAFYDISPKQRWNIVFAHMMLHFLPVLVITIFFWSVYDGELLNHAIILSLIFYMLVVVETAAYLFPDSRKIFKKYFPWLMVPLIILGGYAGYKVGLEAFSSESLVGGWWCSKR